jgi:hypothetical protein
MDENRIYDTRACKEIDEYESAAIGWAQAKRHMIETRNAAERAGMEADKAAAQEREVWDRLQKLRGAQQEVGGAMAGIGAGIVRR